MNALTVLFLAATAACSSGHLLGYPGLYNYPGVLRPYPSLQPYAAPLSHNALYPASFSWRSVAPAPLTYSTYSPSVAPFAPVAPIQSQYHAQDELGQYSFGYAGGPSSRTEVRDAFGVVRGSYNYVDSEGKVQTQHYVADALGFRVAGTNLPVAPEAPQSSSPLALPEPVQDTPEVAAAKVAFKAAYDEAAAAAAAAPDSP